MGGRGSAEGYGNMRRKGWGWMGKGWVRDGRGVEGEMGEGWVWVGNGEGLGGGRQG